METKLCAHCGVEFEKDPRITMKVWAERRYHSRACAQAANKKTRICVVCGKEFKHRYRRTCTDECALKARGPGRGEAHPHWKGGRRTTPDGYIEVRIPDEHEFASMRRNRYYVFEHRLVMAENIGRALRADETVHHKNGDRADNRLENLQLRKGRHGKGAVHFCRNCGSENIGTREL